LRSQRRGLRFAVPLFAALALFLIPGTAQAAPSAAELQAQIDQASKKLEQTVELYDKSTEQVKAAQKQLDQLNTSLGPLLQQRDVARAAVAQVAVSAYTGSGELATVNALLGNDSPTTVLDRLDTLQQIAVEQTDVINASRDAGDKYDAQKAALDRTLNDRNAEVARLTAMKTQIQADLKKLEAQKKQLYGSASSSGGGRYTGKIPAISGKAGIAVRYAYNAIGKPYEWAADGPSSYDCSGLVLAAWRAAGVSLYHNAATQWDEVAHIPRSSLQPGDLVFYESLGHVAIYVGGGQVIHAPTFGDHVRLASVNMMTPYGFGRVRA